jgi:hypothetical protein
MIATIRARTALDARNSLHANCGFDPRYRDSFAASDTAPKTKRMFQKIATQSNIVDAETYRASSPTLNNALTRKLATNYANAVRDVASSEQCLKKQAFRTLNSSGGVTLKSFSSVRWRARPSA